jgi:protein-disulfide isomerase
MRILAATLIFAVSALAGEVSIGSKLTELSVRDGNAPVSISTTQAPATVVVFVSTGCPISNAYNDRMNAIHKDYAARGVQFAFVNANSNETAEQVEQHAKTNGFAFKVYKDPGNTLADQLGATVTPEVFIFDKTGTLQYHGYIDDSANVARVTVHGLRTALDSVIAGKALGQQTTKAFGCTIKRLKKTT